MKRLLLLITLTALSYQTAQAACQPKTDIEPKQNAAALLRQGYEGQAHAQKAEFEPADVKASSGAKALAEMTNKQIGKSACNRDPLLPQGLPGELHELIRAYHRNNYDFFSVLYYAPVPLESLALDTLAQNAIEAKLTNSMVKSDDSHRLRCYAGNTTQRTTHFNNGIVLKGDMAEAYVTLTIPGQQQSLQLKSSDIYYATRIFSIAIDTNNIILSNADGSALFIQTPDGLPLCKMPTPDFITAVAILANGSIVGKQSQDKKNIIWKHDSKLLHNLTLEELEGLKQLLVTIQQQCTMVVQGNGTAPEYVRRFGRDRIEVRQITSLQMKIFQQLPQPIQEKIGRFFNCDIVEKKIKIPSSASAPHEVFFNSTE